MKELFQSRLFRRLFFTYVLVIFTCLIAYTSFIIYENHQMNRFQIERKSELQLEEVGSILDGRFTNAQNISRNLSYSTALKQLYWNGKLGAALDSYDLFMIQSELKNTLVSGGASVYMTIIFLDNGGTAYSSSGVIKLNDAYHNDIFDGEDVGYPYLKVGSLNDVFGFESNRYSFQKECLLYCDAYTYQNGSEIGTVCILFDLQNLENDLEKVLGEGYGGTVLYHGQELFRAGEQEGRPYSRESAYCPGLVYQVHASRKITAEGNGVFVLLLVGMVLISLGFVYVAYWESRKYYMPIGHLEQIVHEEKRDTLTKEGTVGYETGDDQMESLLNGIRSLIGEKNGYREKMLTITPYARTGVLHSMITGNMEKENIRVFSEENYLDLIKPYFIVGIVNLAYFDGREAGEEARKQKVKEIFRLVSKTFSTDEIHIVHYFRDISNMFLIVSYENGEPMDDLFYQIHKYLSTAFHTEKCMVTIGVDIQREDINELQEACRGAMRALDGILTDGRGEVYFLEENSGKSTDYYFPANFREKLKKYLERGQKEELGAMLAEVYQKNWDLGGTPEMYRGLIDELHLAVLKTLREITELHTTHFSVEKYSGLATLQEVFDYYTAALYSIVDSLHGQAVQAEADSRLEDEILSYIDENCYDSELSLQSISEHFRVSSKYLSLLCKKRYDMTYLQYIQNRRIRRAAQLLAGKEYNLSQVAAMCGYANQLTFRRNFKSIMGVNPSDFQ